MNIQIKKFRSTGLLLMATLFFGMPQVHAANWSMEPADASTVGIELTVISVLISNNRTGTLTAKTCEDCEIIQLKITPNTRYFLNGVQEVDLLLARNLTGKAAGVGYNVESKEALEIFSIEVE
ncbi:MAG: hypothetical protein AAF420_12015 [Pseudomonadota bacterium]